MSDQPGRLPVRSLRYGRHPLRPIPRDQDADAALFESIRAEGIRIPLVVRPVDDWHGDDLYEVVDGHGRLMCAKLLGLETVPVLILELTDAQARTFRASLETQQGRTT